MKSKLFLHSIFYYLPLDLSVTFPKYFVKQQQNQQNWVRLVLLPLRKSLSNSRDVWSSQEDGGHKQKVKEEHANVPALFTPEEARMLVATGKRRANSTFFSITSLLQMFYCCSKSFQRRPFQEELRRNTSCLPEGHCWRKLTFSFMLPFGHVVPCLQMFLIHCSYFFRYNCYRLQQL